MAGIALLLLPVASSQAQVPTAPTDWVTDTAGFLSASRVRDLNARLERYQEATGHQVLVWIGKTAGGETIDGWAERTFRSWKIGQKGVDDGLVLFILSDDRTARIEVGYGLEAKLPDAIASQIIQDDLIPRIKEGDHDGAVSTAVNHILGTLGGEKNSGEPGSDIQLSPLQIGFIALVILCILFLAIRYPAFGRVLLWIAWTSANRGGSGKPNASGRGGRSGGGGASGRW